MTNLIFYSLISGLFSLVGGVVLLFRPRFTQKIITPLIAFGAGSFLAAAFFDILPEALESGLDAHTILTATLSGFLFFFILERFLMRFVSPHHADGHSEHTESLAFLLILGDGLHNFLDGIVLALAYTANPLLGLPTALAIAAHEVPQEITDFSVLMHLKWSKTRILLVNIVQSLVILPGVFTGLYLGHLLTFQLPLLLGFTAGVFLYISASDLIPELHHHSGHSHFFRVIFPMLGSVILVARLVSLAHGH